MSLFPSTSLFVNAEMQQICTDKQNNDSSFENVTGYVWYLSKQLFSFLKSKQKIPSTEMQI